MGKIRKIHSILSLAIPFLVVAACAPNAADSPSSTPERVAEIRHVCADTMGLNPANDDYDMCVASLEQTLARMNKEQLAERDRRICLARDLKPDTSEFALCLFDAAKWPVNN